MLKFANYLQGTEITFFGLCPLSFNVAPCFGSWLYFCLPVLEIPSLVDSLHRAILSQWATL